MRQGLIPFAVIFCAVLAVLLYNRVTQPLLARSETARIVCETRLLPALVEATSFVGRAQGSDHGQMQKLVADSNGLRARLVEMNAVVEKWASGSGVGPRALRTVARLDEKEQGDFVTSATEEALRRCPDRARDRKMVTDAVRAVVLVLKKKH